MYKIILYSVDLDQTRTMSPEDLPAPMGIDTLQQALSRNTTYDGFIREFTASLMFTKTVQTWLRGIIDTYGLQSEVQVTIQEYNSNQVSYDLIFTGILNLSSYKEVELYFDCNLEDSSFSRDIKNRENQNIDYNSGTSLDGTLLPGFIDEFFELKLYGNSGSYINDQGSTVNISETTTISALFPFELFTKVIQKLTNSDYEVFKSSLFGRTNLTSNGFTRDYAVNGELAYRMITHGLLIRGWDENGTGAKQEGFVDLVVQFKELFTSYHKQIPLGMGIESETQADGTIRKYVVIEKKEYFYQNAQYSFILGPESIDKFERVVAEEFYYNSIEAGYDKFTIDSRFGSGEFNNISEYSTPLSVFRNKLELLINYRADGAGIEELRWHPKNPLIEDQEEVDGENDIFFIDAFVDSLGELRSTDASSAAGFQSVSGVYGEDPLYYNLKARPSVAVNKWGKWIKVGLQFNELDVLSFQKSEKLSKVSTLLTGETTPIVDGEDINISDLEDPILTGYIIKFFGPLPTSYIQEIQNNPYLIFQFWDPTKEDWGYGFLREVSITPITSETNYALYEISNPALLPGGRKLQENGDYKLQENGDYKLLEAS